jgi:serralysin
VANFYFMYQGTGASGGVVLRTAGNYVAAGQLGAWTPLGVEKLGSGYQVVWKNGSADQYTVWTTDSNGNYLSNGAVVSGFSYGIESLEASFNQNFNGDGTTGVVSTAIESSGSTKLSRVADFYFMYQGTGASGGVVLRLGGNYVAAGQLGAWTPLGAEQVGSGYQVVWKNGSADQYTVWTTDSSGNYLFNGALVSGSSSTLKAFESSFNQDLNANGTIGATAPMTTSSSVFTDVIAPIMILSYGPADETGNDSSGSVNLALLTNYLASTFVPPAGESTGAVTAAQTSEQAFLTKPAA